MGKQYMRNAVICIGACLLSIGLTACGGEPSESDIKTAFDKAVSSSTGQMNALMGSNAAEAASGLMPKIEKIEKVGSCSKKSDSVYSCSVKVTASAMGTSGANVSEVQLAKTNNGWELMQ